MCFSTAFPVRNSESVVVAGGVAWYKANATVGCSPHEWVRTVHRSKQRNDSNDALFLITTSSRLNCIVGLRYFRSGLSPFAICWRSVWLANQYAGVRYFCGIRGYVSIWSNQRRSTMSVSIFLIEETFGLNEVAEIVPDRDWSGMLSNHRILVISSMRHAWVSISSVHLRAGTVILDESVLISNHSVLSMFANVSVLEEDVHMIVCIWCRSMGRSVIVSVDSEVFIQELIHATVHHESPKIRSSLVR